MFDKIFEAQKQAEEIKKRLESITVTGEAEGGAIKVIANANKKILSISFAEDFFKENDQEAIEELIVVAVNKALQQAENVSNTEMAAAAQEMMGGLGNLFGK